jgi:hypothetical protein
MQVEMTDTYKSVHKKETMTSILIRPEFHGHTVGEAPENPHFSLQLSSGPKTLLFKKDFNGVPYEFFKATENLHSC